MDISFLPQGAGSFRTASGITINVLDPKPEMIELNDIVRGLAYKAHFSGQIHKYFSIAEHCLLTERLTAIRYPEDRELRTVALFHDAAEAYIGDMISPIKILFPQFKEMENKLLKIIFEKFGLPYDRLTEVKYFDVEAQNIEAIVFYKKEDLPGYHYSRSMLRFDQPDEAARRLSTAMQISLTKLKQ